MSTLTELAHRSVDGCIENLHLILDGADRGDVEIVKGIVVDARKRLGAVVERADIRLARMNLPGFEQ